MCRLMLRAACADVICASSEGGAASVARTTVPPHFGAAACAKPGPEGTASAATPAVPTRSNPRRVRSSIAASPFSVSSIRS